MRERIRHDDDDLQAHARHGTAPMIDPAASTAAVFEAAARDREPGRGGVPALGRAVDALHASAGNGAIAGLFAGRAAGSHREGTAAVRAARSETSERPVVQASFDDEPAAEAEAATADDAAATELGTGAPTPGPSWTKVGPPSPSTYTVSGSLRDVANTVAARPEAGSVTATSARDFDVWTPGEGEEKVLAARVTVKQVLELPTWSDKSSATKNQQAEWDRFHAAITTHEAGHVSTDKTSFAGTHTTMVGQTPAKADEALNDADTKATAANKDYDTATKSGLSQGTGINPNIDEVTKVP
jgi:hypothetical protein